eukprot:jgi/Undpi1/11699/HiC_scaffold_36.g13994.m1
MCPYRYAHHQNGVMGHFQVRVVALSEISEPDWPGGGIFPYVVVSFGQCVERTSAEEARVDVTGTLRATWPREQLSIEVLKGTIGPGEHPYLKIEVYNQDNAVQSMLTTAVSTVMGSQSSLLGVARLEMSSLLAGGAHLIDTWVELEPQGRVHVHVEYEPKGIEPGPNDVVFLESFARWRDSLVIPPRVPMVVMYKSPPFLLVAFDTFTAREGRVRLHRNSVSVVERLTWLDVTLATAARTETGSWCVRKSRPLLHPLLVVAAPLQAAILVMFSTLKVALRGAMMGTHAVYQESVVNG